MDGQTEKSVLETRLLVDNLLKQIAHLSLQLASCQVALQKLRDEQSALKREE